jgi:hypothetical protein
MAPIAPEVAQTMTALITATVFSAGFLSTRVHRERGRAIDRATKLDEQVASGVRDNKSLDADWFDGQVEALDWSLKDRLDRLVLGLNIALGLGVIGLAIGTGLTSNVTWSGSQGILLLAYAVTALAVITIGTLDVMLARRGVKRHYESTAVGQMNHADSLITRAAKRPTAKKLKQLRETSESAVRYSYGLYGPAWALLGYAQLLRLTKPEPRHPHLLFAEHTLKRAVELGPETAPMRAALARVYELRQDYVRAAANWIRALWIYHEAVRPLAYSDKTVTSRKVRERASGRSPILQKGVPSSRGPYAWRFTPQLPMTLSLALDQLPPYRSAAGLTAQTIVKQSSIYPQDSKRAIQSLWAWLEHWIQSDVWSWAYIMATRLLKIEGSPEIRAAIEKFLSAEGRLDKHSKPRRRRRRSRQPRKHGMTNSRQAYKRTRRMRPA